MTLVSARIPVWAVAFAALIPLFTASPAAAAVSQKQAERKAIAALELGKGTSPVVLFRQTSVVPRGTSITQAGAAASKRASRAAVSRDRALKSAGVKIIKAPVVARTGGDAAWFFYEDQSPYQAYEHPGRVVLVARGSGKVTITKALNWPPLIGGKLPRALADYASYRSAKYRAFARSWVLDDGAGAAKAVRAAAPRNETNPSLPSTLADTPAAKASRREAARLLAEEKSCAIRISDSLGDFYDAGPVDNTRAALGLLFHDLSLLDAGFFTDRYRYRELPDGPGATPAQFITAAIKARGCKDILIYIAGGGTTVGGEPAVNIGTKTRAGGKIETQAITASAVKALIAATPDVTFKVEVDAPRSGAFIDALGTAPNLLFSASSSTGTEGSFTALDDVVDPSGTPSKNTYNATGLLEFTNRQLQGLGCFLSSADEVAAGARAKAQGRSRSFFAWMLARSLSICGRGYLPQVVQNAPVPKLVITFPAPTDSDLNQAPIAAGGALTTDEDTALPLTLTGADTDGDVLTFKIVLPPTHGTLSGGTAGARTYTPNADFNGEDRFTFTVSDGKETSAPVTVVITVRPVNDAPTLTLGSGTSTFTEAGPAVAVDPGVATSDLDDTRLNGATVSIGSGFAAGQDVLGFAAQSGITGSFDVATGVLTLTGDASVADYQGALRSITFSNPSTNLSSVTRQIVFRVNDGDATGSSPARAVAVNVVNDAPVLGGGGSTAAYTEDDATGVFVGPGLTVSDVDSPNLASAQVRITGGLVPAEDELVFANQNGISGSYTAATGTLALTGTASPADYETALRSVRYRNLDTANPTVPSRTISTLVDDGALSSSTQTATVTVARINDAPVVTTGAGTTSFAEGSGAVVVAPTATVADADDANLTGATVRLVAGFDATQDALAFTNTASITGSYNAATGVLTLTGTTTVANYLAALRAITYVNGSDDPSGTLRSVSFTATDGAATSPSVSRDITIVPVNDAPVLGGGVGSASYTEDDPTGVLVHTAVTVADVDDTTLAGATVTITTNRVPAEDDLVFDAQNGITGVYTQATGVLVLSGAATVAEYRTALRSIRYRNLNSVTPSTLARAVTFQVDDGTPSNNLSNVVSSTVSVTAVNDAPSVTTSGANPTFPEGGAAVAIDPNVSVADADDANLAAATVSITGGFDATDDALALPATPGLAAVYNAGTGVLSITGSATKAAYQAALRTVTYANTDAAAPGTAPRTVRFVVNDGHVANNLSAPADATVQVAAVNDAPTLSGGSNTVVFTEDDATGVIVNSGITAADVDSANLAGATVQISANFDASEDELRFTNQNGITGSYSAATGLLTLTGTTTVANYQTALRSIRYRNTDTANPTTAQRVVTFAVSDGAATSNASNSVVTNVTVSPADDAPTLAAGSAAAATFTEGGADVVVDAGTVVGDADSPNLAGASIGITGGFVSAEDRLVFTDTAAITGTYNAASGLLTLTGSATLAAYQAALRSIEYRNVNGNNPSGAPRTVSFAGSDGVLTSNVVTRTVNVSPVNDAPILVADAGSAAFVEGAGPVNVSPAIGLVDVDNASFAGATARITGAYVNGQDVLAFANTANITGSWDAATGTLTLSGSDSASAYQAALRAITFANSSDAPSTAQRTVTFSITDAASATATATRGVTVQPTNDAPVLAAGGGSPTYAEGAAAPVTVDPTVTVADPDGDQITGASIVIGAGFQTAEDRLVYATTHGITGSYVVGTGILTLSGTASAADYRDALRAVQYENVSSSPSVVSRAIGFQVTDGALNSNTATTTVQIQSNNTAPTTGGGGNTLAYTEDDAASIVNGAITVGDADDTNLDGATVQITASAAAEDELTFSTLGTITGSWNAATFTLTLSGSATVANYQAALRTVRYLNNNHAAPSSATRTVGFVVTDGEAISNVTNTSVTVAQNPDAPVLTAGTGNTKTFTEGGSAAIVDDGIAVADADTANASGARVAITNGFSQAQGDTLAFTPSGGITGSYNAATGVFTLSGNATLTQYQTALRSVVFSNTSNNPTSPRTVSFTVTTAGLDSAAVTHQVLLQGVNSPPALAVGGTLAYTENDAATAVSPALTLTDLDSTNIVGATVVISANLASSEDALSFTDTANITGSYSAATGTLTLSGSDTVAAYQAALRAVRYANSSNTPSGSARTVTYTATDDGTPVGSGSTTATINVTPVNDAPSVTGEADTAVGNTRLAYGTNVPAGRAGNRRTAVSVLSNDIDVDGPSALTIDVAASSATSSNGGTVTWNENGTFSYDPAAGFTGVDTLTYKVDDGGTPAALGTGTVLVTVSSRVWYVDNSVADGGDGRSTQPFDTLAEADVAANAANDRIYVHQGDSTATKLGGGVTLVAGQQLIGEAQDLVVGSETLFDSAPADRPTIAGSVQVDDGNTVKGLTIQSQAAAAPAIAGAAGDVSGTLDDLRLTAAAAGSGLSLSGTSGTWNVSNSTFAAAGASATAVDLTNAGTVTFVNTGTIGVTATTGASGLAIAGGTTTAGTIDSTTVVGGATGVSITSNAGALTLDNLSLGTTGAGLKLDSTNGVAITGSTGTITSGGTAVDVNTDANTAVTAAPVVALGSVTSTGGANGFRVSDAGTGSVSATGGSLTGQSTTAVRVDGGSGNVSYGGTVGNGAGFSAQIIGRTAGTTALTGAINDSNDAGGGIVVTGSTGGTVNISGSTKTLNTGAGNGIEFAGSNGFNITGGGLAITTSAGGGFVGTGSAGTISIQGSGNTITSGTGTAFTLNGPDLSAADATLESISSTGATSGIVLQDTGGTGGLHVTGTGTATTGGTIQNSTGPGVNLTNTYEVQLGSVRIQNGGDDGIRGTNVNDFSLTAASQITGNGNAVTERGIDFSEVSGTVLLTGATVTSNAEDNVAIFNVAATIGNLTVNGGTYGETDDSGVGNDGILIDNNGAGNFTGAIRNATFINNRGDHIQLNARGSSTATQNLTIEDNLLRGTGNQPGNATLGGGIALGASGDTNQNVIVDQNDIERPYGSAISMNNAGLTNTVDSKYTITNNAVGTIGEPLSGSFGNVALYGNFDGNGTVRTLVTGNDLRNTAFTPIDFVSGNGDVVSSHTIRNNVIAEPRIPTGDPATQTYTFSVRVTLGGASTDNGGGCLDIGSATPALANQFAGTGQNGFQDLRVRNNGGSAAVNLAGYGGAPQDNAAVNAYLIGRNSKGGTPIVSATRFDNTVTWGQVASCPLP